MLGLFYNEKMILMLKSGDRATVFFYRNVSAKRLYATVKS